MDNILKCNLGIMVSNIKEKYNIPKSKLIKLSKDIEHINNFKLESYSYTGPIYIDENKKQYLLMYCIANNLNYALLIQ